MTDANRDDDLAERVTELEETLAELRTELRQPPTGPFGLPRPPTPRELLRFTEQQAIPTAIAVLEANVRALELLQAALRLTDPGRAADAGATETRDRAERAGRTALERLDGALADLQAGIDEGDLPADGEARDVIEDARGLSTEIRERLSADPATDDGSAAGTDGGADDGDSRETDDDAEGPGVEIDVEGELRSIKDELDDDADGPDDGGDDGTDASGDGGPGAGPDAGDTGDAGADEGSSGS